MVAAVVLVTGVIAFSFLLMLIPNERAYETLL
jgi:hypothetical protein